MPQPKLTKLELRILEALWAQGKTFIREIQETFPEPRPAYTTIQTTVYRLETQNAVRRVWKIGNAHIFEPTVPREAARLRLLDEILSSLGGRALPMMSQLAEAGKLSLVDVRELEKTVQKIELQKRAEKDAATQMMGELTNHLWQSSVFVIMVAILIRAFRKNRAQVRYWLWFSASLKFLIPFSLLLTLGSFLGHSSAAKSVAAPAISFAVVQIAEPFPETPPPTPPTRSRGDWIPLALVSLWACGFAGILLMWFRGWRCNRAAVRSSIPIDIRFPVEVRCSPGFLEPGVVGFFRPTLLLPKGLVERLAPSQLQTVRAHERCHIERRDNATAALHMIVEAVSWFHPLVWWISARLVEERERACDEAVLESGSEPQVYAESVLKACQFCLESPLACLSRMTASELKKRIVRIMTERQQNKLSFGRKLLLTSVGLAAVAVPVVFGLANASLIHAQAARTSDGPLPSFEVASIKPSRSGQQGAIVWSRSGRFTTTGATAAQLVGIACNVEDSQISGGPGWIHSDKFEIAAKEPDTLVEELPKLPPDQRREEMGQMVLSLLVDRFKLKVSHKTKELPVYALVFAKNGPKLQEAIPGDTYVNGLKGADGIAHPGMMRVGPGQLKGQAIPMSTLVIGLSQQSGRKVLDRTGLKGKYDLALTWTPDRSPAAIFTGSAESNPGTDTTPAADSSEPSLFTAMQEQLGLKLESTKGPVEIIVIDHIERPSEN